MLPPVPERTPSPAADSSRRAGNRHGGMRAVIYARYSSSNQRDASIEDQIEICRRYIEREGWTLAGSYEDRKLSGEAAMLRPGFLRLTTDARTGQFDVVVCEAIDRLSRKLADIAALYDQFAFDRIQIHATNIGLVTPMHVAIMGMVAQMYVSDLRDKTRRGQLGRARAGRIPGGLAYGYDVVAPPPGSQEAGERRIRPDVAAVVMRIFRDYAAGRSPRQIARAFNAEGVPGPGGRPWIDTTIRGQADRGTGILNNTLYVGRLSWNRCSYVKDPRTGKRVARVNTAGEQEIVEVPELRIIDDELWQQVKARQKDVRLEMRDAAGNALNRAHRREFLLSGLLMCGCCGGGYTVIGRDRYGCATRRGKGTCDNARTITRQHIETRVLGALRARMLTPELMAEFIRAFADELQATQRDATQQRASLERQLADTERSLAGILRAIEGGAWNDSLRARLDELEARKKALAADLAAQDAPAPTVALHPKAAEAYREQVADLEDALNDPELRMEASDALRALIEKVVLTPDPDALDGLAAELHGDLAMILAAAAGEPAGAPAGKGAAKRKNPRGTSVPRGFRASQLSVVAGTGCHLDLLLAG